MNALMPLSLNNALVADLNPVCFMFSFLEIPLVCNVLTVQRICDGSCDPAGDPPETQSVSMGCIRYLGSILMMIRKIQSLRPQMVLSKG